MTIIAQMSITMISVIHSANSILETRIPCGISNSFNELLDPSKTATISVPRSPRPVYEPDRLSLLENSKSFHRGILYLSDWSVSALSILYKLVQGTAIALGRTKKTLLGICGIIVSHPAISHAEKKTILTCRSTILTDLDTSVYFSNLRLLFVLFENVAP